jgi:hypothetical protein
MNDDGGFVAIGEVAKVLQPGLFEPARPRFVKSLTQILLERPQLHRLFDETDLDMAGEIYLRIGEANAITIRELAALFFPDSSATGAARGIKDRVSRMRRLAHAMICSQRVAPGGYYSPACITEWVRYRSAIWKHAVAWLEICRDADHTGGWVEEQLGQLTLAWAQKNSER